MREREGVWEGEGEGEGWGVITKERRKVLVEEKDCFDLRKGHHDKLLGERHVGARGGIGNARDNLLEGVSFIQSQIVRFPEVRLADRVCVGRSRHVSRE